jgi:hypothetical protein
VSTNEKQQYCGKAIPRTVAMNFFISVKILSFYNRESLNVQYFKRITVKMQAGASTEHLLVTKPHLIGHSPPKIV